MPNLAIFVQRVYTQNYTHTLKTMAATTSCSSRNFSLIYSSSPTTLKSRKPISIFPCTNPCRPNFSSHPTLNLPTVKILHITKKPLKHVFRVPIISCLVEDGSDAYPEYDNSSVHSGSPTEASVDIKLPRRSLLVNFTCNQCGARSQKLINRLAYERGTVFVQCSGCFRHHKLVDNLGLVVEYNFREEIGVDSTGD